MFALDQWGESAYQGLATHSSVSNIVVGLIVVSAIVVQKVKTGEVAHFVTKDALLVMLLYLYAFVSLAWTPRLDLAIPLWIQIAPYLITMVVLAPLTLNNVQDVRRALTWLLIVGGILISGMLLLGNWGYRGLVVENSNIGNPLALATFGGLVACCAIFLTPRRWHAVWFAVRIAITGAAFLLVFKTESRGQTIALAAAILSVAPIMMPVTRIRGLLTIFGVGGALMLAFTLASSGHLELGYGRWSEAGMSGDVEGRLSMALSLLHHWQASPMAVIFGLGNSAAFDPRIVGFYPHLLPLEVLGEEGLLGFIVYLLILWLAFRNFLHIKAMSAGGDNGVAATVAAILVFTFISSLKEGNLLGNVYFFVSILALSRVTSKVQRSQERSEEPAQASLRPSNLLK